MTNQPIQIETVTADSALSYFSQLAEIHSQEIRSGFLAELGLPFLRNLYRTIARSPDAFIFAAVCDGCVVGFICGATNTGRVYKQYLLRRGLLDIWKVIPRILTFRRAKSVLETLTYPSRNRLAELPSAEILNFCVRGSSQRLGIGKRLFACLNKEFYQRGESEIRIVTGAQQITAQRFYESLGATKCQEIEVHQGSRSFVYLYETAPASDLRRVA